MGESFPGILGLARACGVLLRVDLQCGGFNRRVNKLLSTTGALAKICLGVPLPNGALVCGMRFLGNGLQRGYDG